MLLIPILETSQHVRSKEIKCALRVKSVLFFAPNKAAAPAKGGLNFMSKYNHHPLTEQSRRAQFILAKQLLFVGIRRSVECVLFLEIQLPIKRENM